MAIAYFQGRRCGGLQKTRTRSRRSVGKAAHIVARSRRPAFAANLIANGIVLRAEHDVTGTWDAPFMGMKRKRRTTLLDLVQDLQRRTSSEAELVRRVRRLVNSGAVVVTGTFAGQRF